MIGHEPKIAPDGLAVSVVPSPQQSVLALLRQAAGGQARFSRPTGSRPPHGYLATAILRLAGHASTPPPCMITPDARAGHYERSRTANEFAGTFA